MYNRGGSGRKHADNTSLRDQLRQVRQESDEYKNKIQLLTNQINDLHTRKSKKCKFQKKLSRINYLFQIVLVKK